MLSEADQDFLTQVDRGTPAGDWLRCYWHAVAISDRCDAIRADLRLDHPVAVDGQIAPATEWGRKFGTFGGKPTHVRILGEDLVLYRDQSGQLGLLGIRCPHRGASLVHGRPQDHGLACCYHMWTFDETGRCLAMPAEPPDSTFKDKVVHKAYPVRELGGMIFAYLGKGAPPALPLIDVLARNDGVRAIENFALWGANWLQIVENSVDPSHTGTLHGVGTQRSDLWNQIPKVDFAWDGIGIQTRQTRGNYDRTGYLRIPTTILINHPWPGGKLNYPRFTAIFRTPVDRTHTLLFHTTFTPHVDGKPPALPPGVNFHLAEAVQQIFAQDFEAITSQGAVADRTTERLGTTDRGVILLRKVFREAIEAAQRGEDPPGVLRGPAGERILDSAEKVTDGFMAMKTAAE